MGKKTESQAKHRPPSTPAEREELLISLAEDNAERMLRDGTASSQLITTILRQGTRRAKVELELAELQKELTKAKTDSIEQSKQLEVMFNNAIKAMKRYQGEDDEDE